MPLTPFHLGPALALALVLIWFVDLPALLLGSVAPDIEAAAAMMWFRDWPFPIHGFLHSFVGGTLLSLVLSAAIFPIRKHLETPLRFLKLDQKRSFPRIFAGALIGVYSHILLDAPLYTDIKPFWPLDLNPFLSEGMSRGFEIYGFCVTSLIVAFAIYLVILCLKLVLRHKYLNKRGVIILSFFICLALIIGGLTCWILVTSSTQKKPELSWYVERLEEEGYVIEGRPLTEVHVDNVLEVHWFSDFRGIARQKNVSYVYIDREIGALYFLSETGGGEREVFVFYYDRED